MNNSKSDELKAAAETAGTIAAEVKEAPAAETKEAAPAKKAAKPAAEKKTAKSAAEKKETGKPATAKKTAAKPATAKKTAAKPAAEKKTAAKPAAEKKTAVKKTAAKKEIRSSVFIEYAGKQIVAKDVLEAAKKAYESMNKGVAIETIEIYVKPEENAAYYVVNGEGSDQFKVNL